MVAAMGLGQIERAGQTAGIEWRDGVPVSTLFGDPYFSLSDGLAETRHVFLDGNDLPGRFRDGFHIAELGFRTGLNILAAAALWADSGQSGTLTVTSFEAYPMSVDDMARAHAAFDLPPLAADLRAAWAGGARDIALGPVRLRVIEGNARATLPAWDGAADAWFLDGFAPARNPDLWAADLLAEVGRHTRPGGTCATYTAAGHVRRALAAAGFEVTRAPGHGRKRHMTRGRRQG